MTSQDFASRPIKKLFLFDVDDTLTPARQVCFIYVSRAERLYERPDSITGNPRVVERAQKESCDWLCWWFKSGQDHRAARKQWSESFYLNLSSDRGFLVPALDDFDFGFAENGLIAYRLGKPLESQSFIKFVGEERYKKLVNFILHYVADLDIPIKRHAHAYFL
jgi:phosphomannomutase